MSHYFTTPLHGSQTPSYGIFGSMTPHAHGDASAWDPTYGTRPRLVFISIFFHYYYLLFNLELIMMMIHLINPHSEVMFILH